MDFPSTTPVLVIGAGAAGLTAALAAADTGTKVLVLERDAEPTGMTSLSQGFMCAAGSRAQRAAGVEDSADALFNDIMTKTRGQTDPALARLLADNCGPTVDWLNEAHALVLTVDPAWRGDFGHTKPRLHGPPGRTGPDLHSRLLAAAARAKITLRTNATVTDLYATPDGQVLGVAIETPDADTATIGCNALILAAGGFAANRDMVARFIPDVAESPCYTHSGSDGSAITWGLELGAATADMGAFQGHGAFSAETRMAVAYNLVMQGGFEVNQRGERFSNELADISGQAMHVLAQPNGAAWIIYDSHLHTAAQIWPQYRILTERQTMLSAPTAAALAHATGIDPTGLESTLAAVTATHHGAPDPFGRSFAGQSPLTPPYYAIKITGALFHTQGGLVVDHHAQVRRADGTTLPNLFAAGGSARSVSGPSVWGYLPAMGLCQSITLGRLAGTHAATLATT